MDAATRSIRSTDKDDETGSDEPNEGESLVHPRFPGDLAAVLDGRLNLQAALRHNDLRYCGPG